MMFNEDQLVEAAADLAYYVYRQVADAALRIQFVPGPRQPIAAPMFGLEKLAADWNAENPIGTKVIVGGEHVARTASLAWVGSSAGVAIYLKGSRGLHNLDYVKRLEDPNG